MTKYFYSPVKQKFVLLLAAGVTLALSPSPRWQWRIVQKLPRAWKEIDRTILRRIINEFKYERLIKFRERKDGLVEVVLTEKGEKKALTYNPEYFKINKPARWDGKWRIVIFDIPEKKKAAREALRRRLRELGFYQLQRSVWIFPYECGNEIDFITELFEIRSYAHCITAEGWLNDAALRLHFDLPV